VSVDEDVFASERSTGDRNRAIAHLMRSFGMLEGDVDEALDLYFRQCSIQVTCRDLAIMSATLANGGVNPVTGERALALEHVPRVLSVMSTCGMYDYSGEWVYSVGLPAKSGVSGGVVAVLPGQLGVGVYSPRVDRRGNSARGIRVCERVSHDFQLHLLRPQSIGRDVVGRTYRGDAARSHRVRTQCEDAVLLEHGSAIAVFELRGDLTFSTMERVFRTVTDDLDGIDYVVLDGRRVRGLDDSGRFLLSELSRFLHEAGRLLVTAALDSGERPGLHFADVDAALEWCEDRVLEGASGDPVASVMHFAEHPILHGIGSADVSALAASVELRHTARHDLVFREGEAADSMGLLLGGRITIGLRLDGDSRTHRLAAFGPGCVFGETAFLDGGVRSADVIAETDASVALVPISALECLSPDGTTVLYRNLARDVARRLRAANTQIRALDR
jgi:glutaminase